MRITIAVPAYNEADCIEQNVRTLRAECARIFSDATWEIVIAENGSTDGTATVAARLASSLPNVRVVSVPRAGKGAAILAAWNASEADAYAFMDADLSAHPGDLARLVAALEHADVAIGSRAHAGSAIVRGWTRTFVSTLYNALVRLVLRLPHHDHQCGFKALRPSALQTLSPRLSEPGFLFDTELLAAARAAGLRVEEVPVRWEEHRGQKRRSKVRLFRSAVTMAFGLWRLRRRIRHFLIN